VAKILVADDNSNIQKMVSQALKDQGIDVVAVGNGEAAVRKISDVRPDLVLADVFMPVRNGYEVCRFVKTDSALAHIPVILLVGAFDPLDEQEAQRVGADGVLKKPFIPPEPLISMVKSALQRAGVTTAPPQAKRGEPEAGAPIPFTPDSASMPLVGTIPVEGSGTPATNEGFGRPMSARSPIQMDSGAQPTFGNPSETSTEETEEDFVTGAAPGFAMEHDWQAGDESDTDEEEPPSWRPEGSGEEEVSTAKGKNTKSSASDWRSGGFEQIAGSKWQGTEWEAEEQAPETAGSAPVASNRAAETLAAPPPAAPEEPAAISSKPFGTDPWTAPASTVSGENQAAKTPATIEDRTHTESKPTPVPENKEAKDTKDSWYSVSHNPWDAEHQKASRLASTWDAPAGVKAPAARTNGVEKVVPGVSEETQAVIEEAALPPAAVDAIREEAAHVAERAANASKNDTSSEGTSFFTSTEETHLPPAAPLAAAPNVDDLVAKVLAKMSPEVLQAVTREILKPVVEALVKDELKSKKP
jgi:CheY-like chemotaxis protein